MYSFAIIPLLAVLMSAPIDTGKIVDRVEEPQISISVNSEFRVPPVLFPDTIPYGPDHAIGEARPAAAKAHPDDLFDWLHLADLLRAADRVTAADAEYAAITASCEALLEADPKDANAMTALARCKKAMGKTDNGGAKALYEKAIAIDPNNWRAHIGLAETSIDSVLTPLTPYAKLDAAGALSFDKGYEAAADSVVANINASMRQIDEAVRLAPDRTEPLLSRAQHRGWATVLLHWIYAQTGRGTTDDVEMRTELAKVCEDLLTAIRLKPDDLGIRCLLLYSTILPAGNYTELASGVSAGGTQTIELRNLPESIRTRVETVAKELGTSTSIASSEPAPGVLRTLAIWSYGQSKQDEACKQAERLLKVEPGSKEARIIIGLCRMQTGDWPKVREQGEMLLKTDPESEAGVFLAVGSYIYERDISGLEAWLRKCLAVKDTPLVRMMLGKALLAQSQPEAAEPEFRLAASAATPPYPANALWGYTLLKLGRYDEAEKALAEAVRRAPQDPPTLFAHAVALIGLGKTEEAKQALGDCIKIDPTYYRASTTLGELSE